MIAEPRPDVEAPSHLGARVSQGDGNVTAVPYSTTDSQPKVALTIEITADL